MRKLSKCDKNISFFNISTHLYSSNAKHKTHTKTSYPRSFVFLLKIFPRVIKSNFSKRLERYTVPKYLPTKHLYKSKNGDKLTTRVDM